MLQLGTRLFRSSSLGLVTLVSMGEIQDDCTVIKIYYQFCPVPLKMNTNNTVNVFTPGQRCREICQEWTDFSLEGSFLGGFPLKEFPFVQDIVLDEHASLLMI